MANWTKPRRASAPPSSAERWSLGNSRTFRPRMLLFSASSGRDCLTISSSSNDRTTRDLSRVLWTAQRRSADLDDGAMVSEAIEKRGDLILSAEEVVPLIEL